MPTTGYTPELDERRRLRYELRVCIAEVREMRILGETGNEYWENRLCNAIAKYREYKARTRRPDNAMLRSRAEGLAAQLNQDLEPWEIAAIDAELAEITNALQKDGGTLDDPRSAIEAARDKDDAETAATRKADYPL